VGGNVSLYNETDRGPIYPTPVIGLVGELRDAQVGAGHTLRDGDALALVGPFAPSLAGSELAKLRGELGPGLPGVAIEAHAQALAFVRDAVRGGELSAATDVSDGGIACAIAELAIAGGVGASVELDPLVELRGCSGETAVFGEGPGGFVFAGEVQTIERLVAAAQEAGFDALAIGEAAGNRLEISAAEAELSVPLDDTETAWRSLAERMGEPAAA
jgi:phosphoribosylformylglycinamidine synthase subunit PurL